MYFIYRNPPYKRSYLLFIGFKTTRQPLRTHKIHIHSGVVVYVYSGAVSHKHITRGVL